MKYLLAALFFLLCSFPSFSQDSLSVVTDTVPVLEPVESAVELNQGVKSDSTQETKPIQLLPEHYLLTQRLLWGEKGLMRNFDAFKLSEGGRDKEMDIRSTMFKFHQYLGYATLASMIGNGIVGQQLYTGKRDTKDLHEGFAAATNILYFSTAALSFFAPPSMKDREGGLTKLKIHKVLAAIHLSSMIATNVLSGMIEHNPSLKPYHRAAAMTAFGSLFLSTVVIKF